MQALAYLVIAQPPLWQSWIVRSPVVASTAKSARSFGSRKSPHGHLDIHAAPGVVRSRMATKTSTIGTSWCILVHSIASGGILVRSWCILAHSAASRRILLHSDASWCILLHSGASWRILVHSGAFCYILIHPGAFCCILVHPGAFCCILTYSAAF